LKLTAQHDASYDLSDLPPELVKELSEEATREVAHPLIEIIDARGGTAELGEILIDLYRYRRTSRSFEGYTLASVVEASYGRSSSRSCLATSFDP
jgi:hypothetical protein